MRVLRNLISFHDPELSTHLSNIGIGPELYAISWLMTLFAHVFSLEKLYYIWDCFLTGPDYMYLFIGIDYLK
jgi:TBC domain-containing protein kinase-like protein